MKLARFSSPTAAALLLGLTAVLGPGAVVAHAASGTPLPIGHFAHIVVDAPHHGPPRQPVVRPDATRER